MMNIDTNRATELKQILITRGLETGSLVRSLVRSGRTGSRIDEALARLAANQYGTCTVCGFEISARRLRALPFAVRCTRCEDRRGPGAWTVSRGEPRSAASC